MKRVAFTGTALLLPVVLLLLLEGGLRVAGVGAAGREVFIPLPGKATHQALNPAYVTRYFQGFAPSVAFHPFTVEKSPGTVRVLVLGGSSTAGFPYHFYYSFAEELRRMMQAKAPDRSIEVVNLGMSAVNSYTLWDLRHALVEAEPDAVVIYAGHNEYYGAFGVGSTVNNLGDRMGLKRLALRMRHSALYMALTRLLSRAPEAPPQRTMMARVVGDAGITLGSPAYEAGVTQYASNMGDLLATLEDAGIPVLAGRVASNLKDQPPLGDVPAAAAAYADGTAQFDAGERAEAEAAFLEAKDQDGLRFRAPEAINAVLDDFAAAGRLRLVDVPAIARARSSSGIADNSFFDDHLHPNAAGHAAMAAAFYEALQERWDWLAPHADTALDAPLDPIEATYAATQVAVLEAGYPFNKERTPQETNAAVGRMLQQVTRRSVYDSLAVVLATQEVPPPPILSEGLAYAKQTQDTIPALQLYRALLHWRPFSEAFIEEAVGYAIDAPAYDAWTEPIVAFAWTRTRDVSYLNTWAALHLRQQRLADAARLLEMAEARAPDDPVMLFNKARLLVLQGDTAMARTYFERYREAQ